MKRAPRPRKTAELSKSLHRQLNSYALVAGAAGVGVLALTQPTQARIVYTETYLRVFNNHQGVPLDLNNDGRTDFTFVGFLSYGCESSIYRSSVRIAPASTGNAVWSSLGAAALGRGIPVGPKARFAGELLMGLCFVFHPVWRRADSV